LRLKNHRFNVYSCMEGSAIANTYIYMPPANFSKSLLVQTGNSYN